MENAVEALKMAFNFFVFVFALSISINAFSQVRQTSQLILNYTDREYDYTYIEENIDNEGNISTERIVGIESILPTIYRVYDENYKIIFDFGTLNDEGIYKKWDPEENNYVPVNVLDSKNDNLGDEFIKDILYGNTNTNKYSANKIMLNSGGLYDIIKDKEFKEYIGMYYEQDVLAEGEDPDSESNVPTSNKTERRVITYVFVN